MCGAYRHHVRSVSAPCAERVGTVCGGRRHHVRSASAHGAERVRIM
ncbi:MAG: hypothetical protein K2G76_08430 [Prevotella sp.]|nr:hypothetical protein [Prevotella sp.]